MRQTFWLKSSGTMPSRGITSCTVIQEDKIPHKSTFFILTFYGMPQPSACSNFLGNELVATQPGQPANFTPFGQGRKGCVGYKLALVEMKVLMACFLRNLRVTGELCLDLFHCLWDDLQEYAHR